MLAVQRLLGRRLRAIQNLPLNDRSCLIADRPTTSVALSAGELRSLVLYRNFSGRSERFDLRSRLRAAVSYNLLDDAKPFFDFATM